MNVIVLGAGIIGVSVADALAARGAAVTVLDMRSPGRGASYASAGMLAPYAEAHGDANLLRLCTRSLALFDDWIAGLNRTSDRTVEYNRTGTLEIALDVEAAEALVRAKDALDARGVAADLLDAAAIRRLEPSVTPAAVAGLLTHVHGFVGVDVLLGAIVHRSKLAGAIYESPIEAAHVEDRGDVVEVRAGERRYMADVAVVAAGTWSGRVRVKNVPTVPVRPVRGQLLHLQSPAGGLPSRVVWGPDCYTVPRAGGSLLVGATVEDAGFDESATVAAVHDLTAAVVRLLPAMSTARFESVRVGLRPSLPDGLPAIGPVARAPRVVMATGHYRNGVLLAPLTAEIVAAYILHGVRDEAMEGTSPDRFQGRA